MDDDVKVQHKLNYIHLILLVLVREYFIRTYMFLQVYFVEEEIILLEQNCSKKHVS